MSNESNKNADNLQVNTVVGELNSELKQINCLDSSTSCLLNLSQLASLPVLTLFQAHLNQSDAIAQTQHELIHFAESSAESASADELLVQSVLTRAMNPSLLFALILSSLTNFLNEFLSFSSVESSTEMCNCFFFCLNQLPNTLPKRIEFVSVRAVDFHRE
jgi:hypothetical protein